MRKKSAVEQVGVTEDGRPVFGGVFKMQDTYGLPLLLIWKMLADYESQSVIAWDCYCYDALAHGWTTEKIFAGIREVANFCYPREEREFLLAGVTKLLEDHEHTDYRDGDVSVGVGCGSSDTHLASRRYTA